MNRVVRDVCFVMFVLQLFSGAWSNSFRLLSSTLNMSTNKAFHSDRVCLAIRL